MAQSPLVGSLPDDRFRESYIAGHWIVEIPEYGLTHSYAVETGVRGQLRSDGQLRTSSAPTTQQMLDAMGITQDMTDQEQARRRWQYYMTTIYAEAAGDRVMADAAMGIQGPEVGMKLLETVVLTDEQKQQIQGELDAIEERIRVEIEKQGVENATELPALLRLQLKSKLAVVLAQQLLPHQIRDLSKSNPAVFGLPKCLVESPLGEIFELTDGQKESLRSKTDQIIEKMKSDMQKSRDELEGVWNSVLNEEQRKRIEEVYPGLAEKQFFESSPDRLLFLMDFQNPQQEPTPAKRK